MLEDYLIEMWPESGTEPVIRFECTAEDELDAMHQAQRQYPKATIVGYYLIN